MKLIFLAADPDLDNELTKHYAYDKEDFEVRGTKHEGKEIGYIALTSPSDRPHTYTWVMTKT